MSVLNSLVFCAVNVKLALEALVLMSEEVLDDEELVECAYVNEGVAALLSNWSGSFDDFIEVGSLREDYYTYWISQ